MDNQRVIVVTGSSRGIGKGIAGHFLAKNYIVCGCSRGDSVIQNENYFHTSLDLSDENQVRNWIRTIKTNYKRIDTLINNAGLVESALQMAVTPGNVLENFLRTNIAGVYYTCREVSKVMTLQRYGRIINISSIMTKLHEPGTSVYSSCKAAVEEITKVLAREVMPLGITCNSIALSTAETESSLAFGEDWMKKILEKQTLKRFITVDEICNVISFFESDNSSCITGQVLCMGLVS